MRRLIDRLVAVLAVVSTAAAVSNGATTSASHVTGTCLAADKDRGCAAARNAGERERERRLSTRTIRRVTAALIAARMEGRGTATRGGDRAAQDLADRFARLGLRPLGDNGRFFQRVPVTRVRVSPDATVRLGHDTLRYERDFLLLSPGGTGTVSAGGDARLVTVADVARLDVDAAGEMKGRVAIVIVEAGASRDVDGARDLSAIRVAWRRMAALGATGLVVVDRRPGSPLFADAAAFLARPRLFLESANPLPAAVPVVVVERRAGDRFVALQSASKQDVAVRLEIVAEPVRAVGSNVVALLEGRDRRLWHEAIVYSAHYDAFGIQTDGVRYAGAADNAVGVGMLIAIAEAFARAATAPRRSIVFLASTGEEQGRLGSEYWTTHGAWPAQRTTANLNIDGIGTEVHGAVTGVVGFGAEFSTLGEVLTDVLDDMHLTPVRDPFQHERPFYRSDQLSFAGHGVPAMMLLGLPADDVDGAVARARAWAAANYHQPGDVIDATWQWDGPRTLAAVALRMGSRLADADGAPAWRDGSPFQRPVAR